MELTQNANAARQHLSGLSVPLLAWYDVSRRTLPWREHPTAYRVWVSEIMLQQTRVSAVLPYFARFMEKLPSLPALAAADEETLLKLWEGLGYYSRVRNLHRAACEVVAAGRTDLPPDYNALLRLPGIGPYTAGAIASIAYGLPYPAVDGNVLRMFSRLLACEEDIAQPRVKKAFEQLAADLLPADRVGDFNQALMELGATVCLPNGEPLCKQCPVREFCSAYELSSPSAFPVKSAKKPRRIEQRTVLVLVGPDGRVFLRKRPDTGLLAGLWEFLCLDEACSEGQCRDYLQANGVQIKKCVALKDATHIFTHVEWKMSGYLIETATFGTLEGRWVHESELKTDYAVPGAYKTALSALHRWTSLHK